LKLARRGLRVRELSARGIVAACGALALAGCAAHCLRDSDCGDGYECRRDRCELVVHRGDAGVVAGGAGQAGSSQLSPDVNGSGGGGSGGGGSYGSGSGGSGAVSGSGGVGGSAILTDAGAGGSATGGRENLDASGT
jgi:hypothetical protein